jgi:hypothetical protein
MRFSGLMKGYLAWTLAVSLWLTSAFAFGWRMPSLSMGSGMGGSGFGTSRSSGGYGSHSSWSFGK